MRHYWRCIVPENSKFKAKIAYLSDPSVDLIKHFARSIRDYKDPSDHNEYVKCEHIERSHGYMLFILSSRVEILIKPDRENHTLFFVDCEDN